MVIVIFSAAASAASAVVRSFPYFVCRYSQYKYYFIVVIINELI